MIDCLYKPFMACPELLRLLVSWSTASSEAPMSNTTTVQRCKSDAFGKVWEGGVHVMFTEYIGQRQRFGWLWQSEVRFWRRNARRGLGTASSVLTQLRSAQHFQRASQRMGPDVPRYLESHASIRHGFPDIDLGRTLARMFDIVLRHQQDDGDSLQHHWCTWYLWGQYKPVTDCAVPEGLLDVHPRELVDCPSI